MLAAAITLQPIIQIPANLVIVDTETTGLDREIHVPVEVAWSVAGGPVSTLVLPHTQRDIDAADPEALRTNGYYERGLGQPWKRATHLQVAAFGDLFDMPDYGQRRIGGANPRFDMDMLRKALRCEPWHYRPVSIPDEAAAVLGWPESKSLIVTAGHLRALGFDIPQADHTAAGDVAATVAVKRAVMAIQATHALPTVAA
jgi:DNA polymerase-3 subunit epsilon